MREAEFKCSSNIGEFLSSFSKKNLNEKATLLINLNETEASIKVTAKSREVLKEVESLLLDSQEDLVTLSDSGYKEINYKLFPPARPVDVNATLRKIKDHRKEVTKVNIDGEELISNLRYIPCSLGQIIEVYANLVEVTSVYEVHTKPTTNVESYTAQKTGYDMDPYRAGHLAKELNAVYADIYEDILYLELDQNSKNIYELIKRGFTVTEVDKTPFRSQFTAVYSIHSKQFSEKRVYNTLAHLDDVLLCKVVGDKVIITVTGVTGLVNLDYTVITRDLPIVLDSVQHQ